jgi:hypothetical protein
VPDRPNEEEGRISEQGDHTHDGTPFIPEPQGKSYRGNDAEELMPPGGWPSSMLVEAPYVRS